MTWFQRKLATRLQSAYNAVARANAHRELTTSPEPMTNYGDELWVGNITIGTPSQVSNVIQLFTLSTKCSLSLNRAPSRSCWTLDQLICGSPVPQYVRYSLCICYCWLMMVSVRVRHANQRTSTMPAQARPDLTMVGCAPDPKLTLAGGPFFLPYGTGFVAGTYVWY